MSRKGIRDLATLQTMHNRNKDHSREQMVTEFARLEHEKTRLERELHLWTMKKQRTEEALQKVVSDLEAVKNSLMPDASPDSPKKSRRIEATPRKEGGSNPVDPDGSQEHDPRWREVKFDY